MNAIVRPCDFLPELSQGFGWRPETVVAMTWIYFDESGEHGPDGRLRRLTLGCGIAIIDSWQALTHEWNAVLANAGISQFHMADFEARRKPFNEWGDEKRREVLSSLLDIASRHVPAFCGYSGNAADLSGKDAFRKAYGENLIKALKETVLQIDDFHLGNINLFFARHKNISAEMIGRHIDFFNYWAGGRIRAAGFGSPSELAALQVADLAAYEFSRTARQVRPENERYPLLTLAKRAKAFVLYHSTEFDSNVSVWGRDLPPPRERRGRRA
jgi:hypothetical protein